MSPAATIRATLVTHGALGAELLKTAEAILGPQEGCAFVSNAGRSLEALMAELSDRLDDGEPQVLFVDLLGGSCGHVCALIQRRYPKVLLAAGINLPMLLEFLHHRGRVPLGELKARLLERGRDGIRCFGWDEEAPR